MSSDNGFELWQKAITFAAQRHNGHRRKDGKTPYIAHPYRVAMTVRQLFGVDDAAALAAAALHDIIEDTTADYDELEENFGPEVAHIVAVLSKDARLPEEQREEEYDRQLTAGPWQARLIKLADVFDNYCDSEGSGGRKKIASKARRAITCAGDDPRLAQAVEVVRRLLD